MQKHLDAGFAIAKAPPLGYQPQRRCPPNRFGSVGSLCLYSTCSIVAVIVLFITALELRTHSKGRPIPTTSLRIYCAAGIASPVQEIIEGFNRTHTNQVEIVRTGGSGELLGQIQAEFQTDLGDGADLFISADSLHLDNARRDGIVNYSVPFANQHAVVAMRVERSTTVDSFESLVNSSKIKIGLGSNRSAIGRLTRLIAARDGFLKRLEERSTTDAENVMTLAQAVAAGSLDAAIIWDTSVHQINQRHPTPKLKSIAYADPRNELKSELGIGILTSSDKQAASLEFCQYLSKSFDAKVILTRHGYDMEDHHAFPSSKSTLKGPPIDQ